MTPVQYRIVLKLDKSGKTPPRLQSLVKIRILFFFGVRAFDQKELLLGFLSPWLFYLSEFHFLNSAHNCVDWKTQYALKYGLRCRIDIPVFIWLWFH